MRVQLELYASLMQYLPPNAERHRVVVEVASGATAHTLLDLYHVPREKAHLVLRNGVFLHQEERNHAVLAEGDVIAVWPPVAGG